MRESLLLFTLVFSVHAETYTLTLKQAVDRALAQNPEVTMARLDELKAQLGIRVARDPFTPHFGVGSGAAYSNGFPLSIEGSAPAAFEAKGNEYIFNRPQTYAVAEAKESARAAAFATVEKSDEIAFRVASLYIDADRAARLSDAARQQVESLQKVFDAVEARVSEGRELPIASQEASVNLLRARQRLASIESDLDYAGRSLAAALGYAIGDSVRAAAEERAIPEIPNEQSALDAALNSSNEVKRLQSTYAAKALEIKGDHARRLPQIDLVAQYALLTKYSHYDEYFARFQRNNGQIGASIQIPVYMGAGAKAALEQAETDERHIGAELDLARSRIALQVHQAYQDMEKANLSRQLAQADLDLTRSQLSVVLAQMNEGRASLRQVEEARFSENEKWIAFYDAQSSAERAVWNVLHQTGHLQVALR